MAACSICSRAALPSIDQNGCAPSAQTTATPKVRECAQVGPPQARLLDGLVLSQRDEWDCTRSLDPVGPQ